MSDKTGISWTDATWNPIRDCSRVSEGCRHYYAELMAARFSGPGQPYEGLAEMHGSSVGRTGVVRFVPERLADPLRWRKPRRIFVNSMPDLFHESLTNERIATIFGVMAACPQHTFQVLTKRAKRMREWFDWLDKYTESAAEELSAKCTVSFRDAQELSRLDYVIGRALKRIDGRAAERMRHIAADYELDWPLANMHLGVSVEDQEAADERIPELLTTPAAVRWISAEPLLGMIDIAQYFDPCSVPCGEEPWPELDWVVAGCESGPGARPCDADWLRSLRDQCAGSCVPFWLKQASEVTSGIVAPACAPPEIINAVSPFDRTRFTDTVTAGPGSKRRSGGVIELPYLDGVQHKAQPRMIS